MAAGEAALIVSEMRRAAAGLVERRRERFTSAYDLATSKRRMAEALERNRHHGIAEFTPAWHEQEGALVLEAVFDPPRRVLAMLRLASFAFLLLVAGSAWVIASADDHGALRFLLPMFTVMGVLGFPFVALGLASARSAREAQARKVIRAALGRDEEPRSR